jgi:hypothetical protein
MIMNIFEEVAFSRAVHKPVIWFCYADDTRVYPKFPDWLPGARTSNGKALCH